MPCRINVFSGRKRERSPRKIPPKGDFVGFSHGDLLPRQVKIRQIVAENATHGMSRTFVWRGERPPCENTNKSPFHGFSRGAFSPRKHDNTTWHKSATIVIQKNFFQLNRRRLKINIVLESSICWVRCNM